MATKGPFELVCEMAEILDDLGMPYALGGSMASSLLERVGTSFYVPVDSARAAIESRTSFNLLDTASALKVDLFVVGDGLLDRMQIERRVLIDVPGAANGIWVTAAEDQVLRKLDWFRQGGSMSDRQWRDVVGILRIHHGSVDLAYLTGSASELGLGDELAEALRQATGQE